MANPNKQPLALERCRLRTPHPRLRVACFLPSCRKQPQHLLHPRPKRLVCFAGPFLSIFFKLFSFFFLAVQSAWSKGPPSLAGVSSSIPVSFPFNASRRNNDGVSGCDSCPGGRVVLCLGALQGSSHPSVIFNWRQQRSQQQQQQ